MHASTYEYVHNYIFVPVSVTVKRRAFSAPSDMWVRMYPLVVNLRALLSRFINICHTKSWSETTVVGLMSSSISKVYCKYDQIRKPSNLQSKQTH